MKKIQHRILLRLTRATVLLVGPIWVLASLHLLKRQPSFPEIVAAPRLLREQNETHSRKIVMKEIEKALLLHNMDEDYRKAAGSTKTNKRNQKKRLWHLNLPTPIIVMGFPKAGTSSIHEFFVQQLQNKGFKATHWYCCGHQSNPQKAAPGNVRYMSTCLMSNLKRILRKENNVKLMKESNSTAAYESAVASFDRTKDSLFAGCNDIDLYSEINGPRSKFTRNQKTAWTNDDGTLDHDGPPGDRLFFPQYFHIEKIHLAYPNATWILNTRPVEKWVESVMKWDKQTANSFAIEWYLHGALNDFPQTQEELKAFLRNIHKAHHEQVRQFVRGHPTHALIEVDISTDSARELLADAFGLNATHWGNHNRNAKVRVVKGV